MKRNDSIFFIMGILEHVFMDFEFIINEKEIKKKYQGHQGIQGIRQGHLKIIKEMASEMEYS